MSREQTVHLGFAIGSGEPVSIPLAHTFVTGQTQLSGKTTTLRAIVCRSGRRALAFVTKRGEQFEGRRIRPYLPREGEQPIHWRLVETILASALGQRSMKYERYWLVNACKGAKSLTDVRRNVDRLKAKAKGSTAEVYELIGEYLDLVLPEMHALAAADVLDLQPGLNVMDLAGVGAQLQALVIRAAMERVNQHEKGILTVFPEAWAFAPRNRAAPAKDEAIAMARKGAVLGNYLLCDSQDIAGVDTVVRQAASVWILGVQRELNELKRTIDSIPAGTAKPKSADVSTLECGQFWACWGRHAIKTYVQPDWMDEPTAQRIARGRRYAEQDLARLEATRKQPRPEESRMSPEQEQKLDRLLEITAKAIAAQAAVNANGAAPPSSEPRQGTETAQQQSEKVASNGALDEDGLYQRFKKRLLGEVSLGGVIVQVTAPEKLRKDFQREEAERILQAVRELEPLAKRVMKLVEGLEGQYLPQKQIAERLGRATGGGSWVSLTTQVKQLAAMGLLTIDGKRGVTTGLRQKIAGDLATYQPADDEVEAVYQTVLHEIAGGAAD